MKNKVIPVEDAMAMIQDGDVIAITAAGMVGYPEYAIKALEKRFLETGSPKGLTVTAGCGHGIFDDRLDCRFGHPGFLKRYIGSHPDTVPPIRDMIGRGEIEGYCLPQGILNQLYRASAAKQPGLISKIGLGTYIDPRQDGGKLNGVCPENIVELMEIDGEEWLFYKNLPVTVAIVRGTTADENGNITIEHEALKLETLEAALAAKGRNGKVIVQVKRVAATGTLNPKDVVIPGEIVDAVVVTENIEEDHRQTKMEIYNPYLSGELKKPKESYTSSADIISAEDVICRRATLELYDGAIVNIGVGIGAGIGKIAETEGMSEKITFTLELGTFGGIPTPLSDFGAAFNAVSYIAHPTMFDFYHGGGLDITFLGTAQVDKMGNVNVSKFGNRAAGQGGFIDISQTSQKVVFVTFFKAKGFESKLSGGEIKIEKEGAISKFVDTVDQITFNGSIAAANGQEVIYITERAVFVLTENGLMLTEIAPGIDLERDVLGQMTFTPIICDNLKFMDNRVFVPGRMGYFD